MLARRSCHISGRSRVLLAFSASLRLSRSQCITVTGADDPGDVFAVPRELDSLAFTSLRNHVREIGPRNRYWNGETLVAVSHVVFRPCKRRAAKGRGSWLRSPAGDAPGRHAGAERRSKATRRYVRRASDAESRKRNASCSTNAHCRLF